ncbi:MAG: CRTAC1 family protein [Acidobacteria bacterium]|nr:CRTAC1 family protein [Acidobacteriota bacterium]
MPRALWVIPLLLAAALAPSVPAFRDTAERAGITALIVSGGPKKNYVLEVNGSGACWLDYNGDGWMDLYLVNGATLAQLQGKAPAQTTNHLYRNNRDGTFTDVTAAAGVPGRGWGFGCAAADYDNDGHTDLLVTNYGPNILYRNRGDGTFADVTVKAGVGGGQIWHAGPAFGDYDLDGRLDLFVPGYLDFDAQKPELRTCEYRGVKVHACGPLGYKGAPDALYRNNGDGTFTDVTEKAGVADRKLYFGFQAVFEDFDNDGRPDLFVANDSNPNYLYRNKGDGTFEEIGVQSGVAYSADGKEMSSMGVAVGDYDHDGRMDLFITTFANDNYVLLHNDGGGFFTDVSYPAGVGEPTVPYLGWATFFFDYDNDGHPDLFCANGHVYPEVEGAIKESFRQPLQLFRNLGNGKFREVSLESGLRALPPQTARGGAFADFDNDGDLDVVVSVMDGKPLLLENSGGNRAHWLRVELTGETCNRMAVGARVKVTAGGLTQYSTVRAGGSYLSSNDPRLHFGLGSSAAAEVEVAWPGGGTEKIGRVKANQAVRIRQGRGLQGR